MIQSQPKDGMMVVLSSPSGAGKTTLARMLLQRDSRLRMSTSCTTREKRPGEEEGKDYYFVSREAFEQMAAEGKFLEHAHVFGNRYGTPKDFVAEKLARGEDVLFDIDWQGARQLRQNTPFRMVSIFILPPSFEELERRLRERKRDKDGDIERRLALAKEEMSHQIEYNHVVVNHDLEAAYQEITNILARARGSL